MKVTVLGSGSPEAYARRASTGYLVETGESRLMIDCGGGSFDNLLRAGFDPSDVTHLVFSHLHSDHMMDYARLVHAAWDEGAAPLSVWGPAPLAGITDGYFGPTGVLSHDLTARCELRPSQDVWVARGGTLPRPWPAPQVTEISPGDQITGPDWTLTTCEVPHAQPHLMCLGMRIEAGGKSLVYSGDAGICAEFETLAQGADLMIHWCYRGEAEPVPHPDFARLCPEPSEIGAMARRCDVGRLVLSHFRKAMDDPGAAPGLSRVEEARTAAHSTFGKEVHAAEDLDIFTL